MTDRIDRFVYQSYIPEENRGGEYGLTLFLDGKYTSLLTPKEADKLGWTIDRIHTGINANLLLENEVLKNDVARLVSAYNTLADAHEKMTDAAEKAGVLIEKREV